MKKKAQSIVEYAVLISIVAAAFMAMHIYLQRATQARLHQVQKELQDDIEVISVSSIEGIQ